MRVLLLIIIVFTTVSTILYIIYTSNNVNKHFVLTPVTFISSPVFHNTTSSNTLLEQNSSTSFVNVAFETSQVVNKVLYEPNPDYVNSKLCRDFGESLQLLVVVTSAPSHENARMAIRQTWGHFSARRDISVGFIVGLSPYTIINEKVNEEEYMYGDIIRGRLLNADGSIMSKTISTLKWIAAYCFKAAFILKASDDMFINVPRLLTFTSMQDPETRAIYGRLATKLKLRRYEKMLEYAHTALPSFIIGPNYVFPGRLSSELYLAAMNHTQLKFEDVFLTGIVANYLQVERIHVAEFINKHIELTPCNIKMIISVRVFNKTDQLDLWTKLFKKRVKCT